jgi:hypothetical protein
VSASPRRPHLLQGCAVYREGIGSQRRTHRGITVGACSPAVQDTIGSIPDGAAKEKAGLDGGEERLSWHSLCHSYASILATDLELPATTLARIVGHADAGFSLKVYAKDARDENVLVRDVLARAASALVGR